MELPITFYAKFEIFRNSQHNSGKSEFLLHDFLKSFIKKLKINNVTIITLYEIKIM
jgi:hypothetical protein